MQPAKAEEELAGLPPFFSTRIPGKLLSVNLDDKARNRLCAEVIERFPEGALQISGILLGKRQGVPVETIHVDGFVPLPSEHQRGPSYILSPSGKNDLAKALADRPDGGDIVGFYRCDTRTNSYCTPEDVDLFREFLPAPDNILLIMKITPAGAGTGRFFLWEGNAFLPESTRWFPVKSTNADQLIHRANAGSRKLKLGTPDVFQAGCFVLMLLVFAIVGIQNLNRRDITRTGKAGGVPKAGTELEVFQRTGSSLNFAVSRSKTDLSLSWDKTSIASLNGQFAVLSIQDGPYQRTLDVDLRTSVFIYSPITDNVTFLLTADSPDGPVSESVRVINALRNPSAVSQEEGLERPLGQEMHQ